MVQLYTGHLYSRFTLKVHLFMVQFCSRFMIMVHLYIYSIAFPKRVEGFTSMLLS